MSTASEATPGAHGHRTPAPSGRQGRNFHPTESLDLPIASFSPFLSKPGAGFLILSTLQTSTCWNQAFCMYQTISIFLPQSGRNGQPGVQPLHEYCPMAGLKLRSSGQRERRHACGHIYQHASMPVCRYAHTAAAPKEPRPPVASRRSSAMARRFEGLPSGRQEKPLPSCPQRLPPLCAIIRAEIAATAA